MVVPQRMLVALATGQHMLLLVHFQHALFSANALEPSAHSYIALNVCAPRYHVLVAG